MNLIHELFGTSLLVAIGVILNLFLVEGLLSIDNAAVLATMVGKLKGDQKKRALHVGIWGAIIARGLSLAFASYLTGFWILKVVGGLYLLYLAYGAFKPGKQTIEEGVDPADEVNDPDKSKIVLWCEKNLHLNQFWSTVILVEIMDMAFSVDNIFAAVAFTKYLGLIYIGVFAGIFAMRYVAEQFMKLMEKYPFLEKVAMLVIGILGVKLTLTIFEHLAPDSSIAQLMGWEHFDLMFSLLTLLVFFAPVVYTWLGRKYGFVPLPPEGEESTPEVQQAEALVVELNKEGNDTPKPAAVA